MSIHNRDGIDREALPLVEQMKNLQTKSRALPSFITWRGHDLYLQSLDVLRSGSQGFIRREGKIIAFALANISALSFFKASQLTIRITALLVGTATHILVREMQFNYSFNRLTKVFKSIINRGFITSSLLSRLSRQEQSMIHFALFSYLNGLTEKEKNNPKLIAKAIAYLLVQQNSYGEVGFLGFEEIRKDIRQLSEGCQNTECLLHGFKELFSAGLAQLSSEMDQFVNAPARLNETATFNLQFLVKYIVGNSSSEPEGIEPSSFFEISPHFKRRALKNLSRPRSLSVGAQKAAYLLEVLQRQFVENRINLFTASEGEMGHDFYNSIIDTLEKRDQELFVSYAAFKELIRVDYSKRMIEQVESARQRSLNQQTKRTFSNLYTSWDGHALYLLSSDVLTNKSQGFIRREGRIIFLALATMAAFSFLKTNEFFITRPIVRYTAILVGTAAHIHMRERRFGYYLTTLTTRLNKILNHTPIPSIELNAQERSMLENPLFHYRNGLTEQEKNSPEQLAKVLAYILRQPPLLEEDIDYYRENYLVLLMSKFCDYYAYFGNIERVLHGFKILFSEDYRRVLCKRLDGDRGFELKVGIAFHLQLFAKLFVVKSDGESGIAEFSSFDTEGLSLKRRALSNTNPELEGIPPEVQKTAELLEELHKQLLKNKIKLSQSNAWYGIDKSFYDSMIEAVNEDYRSMFADYATFNSRFKEDFEGQAESEFSYLFESNFAPPVDPSGDSSDDHDPVTHDPGADHDPVIYHPGVEELDPFITDQFSHTNPGQTLMRPG